MRGWRNCSSARAVSQRCAEARNCGVTKVSLREGRSCTAGLGRAELFSPNTTLGQMRECEHKLCSSCCPSVMESLFSILCLHTNPEPHWGCSPPHGTRTLQGPMAPFGSHREGKSYSSCGQIFLNSPKCPPSLHRQLRPMGDSRPLLTLLLFRAIS